MSLQKEAIVIKNELESIYLADWLDRTMGSNSKFRYKLPSFKYVFSVGILGTLLFAKLINVSISAEEFNLIFLLIILAAFVASYFLTYKLINKYALRKNETRYIFHVLIKRRYECSGVSREYYIQIFGLFGVICLIPLYIYKHYYYGYGFFVIFTPNNHASYILLAATLMVSSNLGEFLAFVVKLSWSNILKYFH